MNDASKVLTTKFTDERFPIEWKNEEEKGLMWFCDDLHCPNPMSASPNPITGRKKQSQVFWRTKPIWGTPSI